MSSEHKKPLFALVVITVACCVFMGYTVRANALIGGILSGEKAPAFVADALRLGGGATPEAPASARDNPDKHEVREPRNVLTRSAEPKEHATAKPVARPGFGKHGAKADKAGRTVRSESRRPNVAEPRAERSHANRSSHGNRDHLRGYKKHQRSNHSSHHNNGHHNNGHGNRDHQRGYKKHQRSNHSSHGNRGYGNRDHQRGYEKHQRSRGHDRGHHGRH